MEKIHRKGLYFESKDAGNSQDSGFPRHMHEEFELYYFLEGSADYVVGEKVYPLVPYDLLLIRPAVYHFPVLHEKLPYRRIVFSFTEECVPREALPALKTADILHYAPPASRLGQFLAAAEHTVARYSEEDALRALQELLGLILLEFKYETPAREERADVLHPRLSEILRYIDSHLTQPMSVSSLSAQFFVSPSWLTHAFSDYLHIGVMQYVHSKKILRAQRLIRTGTTPTQAAADCGFANYSTFFRLYRTFFGVSPAQDKK